MSTSSELCRQNYPPQGVEWHQRSVGQIVSRRYDVRAFVQTFKSAVNSSMFISQNFFFYLVFGCISSKLLGRLCILPATFLSGFFSAACAIIIERPRRRAMLAGYMLNLTTDILYRMLRSRGLVRDIQHGEVALFALSLGAYIYYARKHGYFEDPVTFVIRHLFGAEELHGTESKKTKHASLLVNGGCQANGIEDGKDPRCNATSPVNGTARVNGSGIVDGFRYKKFQKRPVMPKGSVLTSRHLSCQHPFGCLAQFCRNMAKFASLGWAVGFGISLLGDLKRLPGRRRPFLAHVLGPSSLRSACFLGGLTGIYKVGLLGFSFSYNVTSMVLL
ncbi:transmembrane protein 135 [Ixodes scapularis]